MVGAVFQKPVPGSGRDCRRNDLAQRPTGRTPGEQGVSASKPATTLSRLSGVGLQIVRDWDLRFNAHGLEGLTDRKAPGPKLNAAQRQALARKVELVI